MRVTTCLAVAAFSVAAADAQRLSQSPSGAIGGYVVTPWAGLIEDASVTLTSLGAGATRRETSTDEHGGFSFSELPPGRYHLAASKPGFTLRRPAASAGSAAGSAAFQTGLDLTLSEYERRAPVELVLWPAAAIAGRIIGADGSAAANVRVMAARRDGGQLVTLPETATVSAFDGRYEIVDLPPGLYYLAAMQLRAVPPTADLHRTWYPGVRDTGAAEAVRVLEGVNAEGIDIWLTPAQRFNVSGRVFWPVGTSPERVSIDYGDPEGNRSGVWYVSDPGGLFRLTNVAPGPLVLLARARSGQGTLMGLASTEVSVDAVEDIRIVIDRPGVIEGRVVYAEDVPPEERASSVSIVQALFRVSAIYPVPESEIDSAGRFRLTDALGEYTFRLDPAPGSELSAQVYRDGRRIESGRLRVGGGESVNGIEIRVGRR